MGLMNFSTSVAAEKSVGEIEAILVKHRVRGVQKRYDAAGEITSLAFSLETPFGERSYRLPVNVDGVLATLEREKQAGRLPNLPWTRLNRHQAARVAFRILKDWLESQLAVIQTRAVTLDQILLPFQVANDAGETVYQLYQRQQAALPAPKSA